jgi:hypothetical protein
VNMHETVMRNASRCADLVRIGGAKVLSRELLEQGYSDCWYAYAHAATQVRRLTTRGQYQASGRWLERRDGYGRARRAIWEEMVHRGMRHEAPLPAPRLGSHAGDGHAE